jgi:hypothetical protein
VSLPNEHTGVMDGFSQTALEDLCLQSTFQEILDLQGQHVIQSHAVLVQHTNTDETTDESVALEKTLGVFVIELEKLTSGASDF